MTTTGRAVGIAWFGREDDNRCLKIFVDRGKLPDRYDQWLKRANHALEQLKAQVHIVEKAYIDPDTFPAWCASRGLDIDADARMAYGNEVVAQKYRDQS